MRVLHLNKRYPPHIGGIEAHVQALARAQAARPDTQVDVAAVAEGRPGVEYDDGVRVHLLPQLGVVASNPLTTAITRFLADSDHDVWHVHYPYPTGEAGVLQAARRRASTPPVVCTYHSDFVAQSWTKTALRAPYSFLTRAFVHRVDRIIVSSPQLAAGSRFLRGVEEKIRVVPFGIDTGPFAADESVLEAARALRARHERPLTLFVGRLVRYKGVEVLLEAFEHVPGTLVLVGNGPLRAGLEARAAGPRLAGRVVFAGSLSTEELVAYYHAADVFVLPSVTPNEAFGLVQLEAHACGVPVVSTDLPTGVPFANKHGETGLVVPPGDATALAAALRVLLEDEGLRARLGRQARDRQRRDFSLGTMTDKVSDVYEELLSGR